MPNYQLLVELADEWVDLTALEAWQLTEERSGRPFLLGGASIIGL